MHLHFRIHPFCLHLFGFVSLSLLVASFFLPQKTAICQGLGLSLIVALPQPKSLKKGHSSISLCILWPLFKRLSCQQRKSPKNFNSLPLLLAFWMKFLSRCQKKKTNKNGRSAGRAKESIAYTQCWHRTVSFTLSFEEPSCEGLTGYRGEKLPKKKQKKKKGSGAMFSSALPLIKIAYGGRACPVWVCVGVCVCVLAARKNMAQ